MSKEYYSLGLMSGTSLDGIDASIILSDGENKLEIIDNCYEKYNHKFEGRNSRLDGLQAAILSVKLRYLDRWTDHRIMLAETYIEELQDIKNIILPVRQSWVKHVYHLFVIRHEMRDSIKSILESHGVATGIHYPVALPKLSAYKHLRQDTENGFAWSSDCELLSLPVGDHMTNEHIDHVLKIMRSADIKSIV